MAIFSHYGGGQRAGFALVCIGFCLCFSGSIAPYWLTAKAKITDIGNVGGSSFINDLSDDLQLGDITLFEINVGIWYYCVDYLDMDNEKCYSLYDTSDYKGPDPDKDRFDWINIARCAVVLNIVLSFTSGLVACCRCLCCSGGRTICHGVFSFFAGVCGFSAFLTVNNHTKSLLNVPIEDVHNDWAMGIYCLGSALLIIASIFLCFARPRETGYGMVVAAPNSGVSVNVTNSNVSQYNAGVPVQGFEPLPNPVALQNVAAGPYAGTAAGPYAGAGVGPYAGAGVGPAGPYAGAGVGPYVGAVQHPPPYNSQGAMPGPYSSKKY